MRRIDQTFLSQGQRCEPWLYLPEGHGPHPCVVIAHGIGAIRQVRLSAYAERFTRAGAAVLTFNYRHWGASEGAPRFLCDIGKQHRDIHAALDHVATLEMIRFLGESGVLGRGAIAADRAARKANGAAA